MRDRSLHSKRDGRVFQMRHGSATFGPPGSTMPFRDAMHNYTKRDLDSLPVGGSMGFIPMFGNTRPVCSVVVRLK